MDKINQQLIKKVVSPLYYTYHLLPTRIELDAVKEAVFWIVKPCGCCMNIRLGGMNNLIIKVERISELEDPVFLHKNNSVASYC
jgi:hypothetical protein